MRSPDNSFLEDPAVTDALFFNRGARALAEKIGKDNFPTVPVSQFDIEQKRTVLVEKPGLIVPVPQEEGEGGPPHIPSIDLVTLLEPDGTVSVLKPNGSDKSFKSYGIDTIDPGTADYLRIHDALDRTTQAYLAKINAEAVSPSPEGPDGNGPGPVKLYNNDDTVAA